MPQDVERGGKWDEDQLFRSPTQEEVEAAMRVWVGIHEALCAYYFEAVNAWFAEYGHSLKDIAELVDQAGYEAALLEPEKEVFV